MKLDVVMQFQMEEETIQAASEYCATIADIIKSKASLNVRQMETYIAEAEDQ